VAKCNLHAVHNGLHVILPVTVILSRLSRKTYLTVSRHEHYFATAPYFLTAKSVHLAAPPRDAQKQRCDRETAGLCNKPDGGMSRRLHRSDLTPNSFARALRLMKLVTPSACPGDSPAQPSAVRLPSRSSSGLTKTHTSLLTRGPRPSARGVGDDAGLHPLSVMIFIINT
jgi:hypothetical protein